MVSLMLTIMIMMMHVCMHAMLSIMSLVIICYVMSYHVVVGCCAQCAIVESTRKDMIELSRGFIRLHLIVTIIVAFIAFIIEHTVVWIFGLPSRKGCQTCWYAH
jgi:hypothetical protein